MNEDVRAILEMFFHEFNSELERLGCGARVQADDDDDEMMVIVDLDGSVMSRTTRDIEPAAFASMMLVVEAAFAEGVAWGRDNPASTHPPSIVIQ